MAFTFPAPARTGIRFDKYSRLIALAALLFAFVITFFGLQTTAHDIIQRASATADAQVKVSILAFESSIENEVQALRDLAGSSNLAEEKLERFHAEITAFGKKHRRQVVLFDLARNEQVLNSAQKFGAPLGAGLKFPHDFKDKTFGRVFVSNLTHAPLILKHIVVIAIPVKVKEKPYFLGVAIDPGELLRTLQDAQIDAETVSSIVDRNGVILARTQEHNKFIGRKAPRNVTSRAADQGNYRGVSLDGNAVIVSYAKSQVTGWGVVSVKKYEDAFIRNIALASVSALAAFVFVLVLIVATKASRRRASPLI